MAASATDDRLHPCFSAQALSSRVGCGAIGLSWEQALAEPESPQVTSRQHQQHDSDSRGETHLTVTQDHKPVIRGEHQLLAPPACADSLNWYHRRPMARAPKLMDVSVLLAPAFRPIPATPSSSAAGQAHRQWGQLECLAARDGHARPARTSMRRGTFSTTVRALTRCRSTC